MIPEYQKAGYVHIKKLAAFLPCLWGFDIPPYGHPGPMKEFKRRRHLMMMLKLMFWVYHVSCKKRRIGIDN